jgi:hypothetical protein
MSRTGFFWGHQVALKKKKKKRCKLIWFSFIQYFGHLLETYCLNMAISEFFVTKIT